MFIYSLYVFLISLALSLTATFLICRTGKAAKNHISHSGGIAIWSSFSIASLSFFMFKGQQLLFTKEITAIYICSSIILLFGMVDDKKELSVFMKFLTQLLAAVIVMAFGVSTKIAGIGEFANLAITLLWILGITNAFNHLDIVDGLASGIAFISVFTFYLISSITFNITIALILFALAGSLLGFFRFNFPKARIYMGNSGSHFIGFILSTLAIMISYATVESRVALIIPLLVLGLPIFDTIFVIWIRLLKKKPVWSKSDDHLTLRLIFSGLSKKQTVLYMFLLASLFCLCSILILYLSNKVGTVLLGLLVVFCIRIALKAKKIKINE